MGAGKLSITGAVVGVCSGARQPAVAGPIPKVENAECPSNCPIAAVRVRLAGVTISDEFAMQPLQPGEQGIESLTGLTTTEPIGKRVHCQAHDVIHPQ